VVFSPTTGSSRFVVDEVDVLLAELLEQGSDAGDLPAAVTLSREKYLAWAFVGFDLNNFP